MGEGSAGVVGRAGLGEEGWELRERRLRIASGEVVTEAVETEFGEMFFGVELVGVWRETSLVPEVWPAAGKIARWAAVWAMATREGVGVGVGKSSGDEEETVFWGEKIGGEDDSGVGLETEKPILGL